MMDHTPPRRAAAVLRCRHCGATLRVPLGRIPARCEHCQADEPLPEEVRHELERQIEVRLRSDVLARDLEDALEAARKTRWLVLAPLGGAAALGGLSLLYALYLALRWLVTGSIPLHPTGVVVLLAALVLGAVVLLLLLPVGAYAKELDQDRRFRPFKALAPTAGDQPARCRNCGADLPRADRGLVTCSYCHARSLVDWRTFRRRELLLEQELSASWEEGLAVRRGWLAHRYGLRRQWLPIVSLLALTLGLLLLPFGFAVPRVAAALDDWLVRHSDEYSACAAAARNACVEPAGADLEALRRACAHDAPGQLEGRALEAAVERRPLCSPFGIGRLLGRPGTDVPAVLAGLARGMDAAAVAASFPTCPAGACRLDPPPAPRGRLDVTLELAYEAQGLAGAELRFADCDRNHREALVRSATAKWVAAGPPEHLVDAEQGAESWVWPPSVGATIRATTGARPECRLTFRFADTARQPSPLAPSAPPASTLCSEFADRAVACLLQNHPNQAHSADAITNTTRRYRNDCGRMMDLDPTAAAEALEACRRESCADFKSCVTGRWTEAIERAGRNWRRLTNGFPPPAGKNETQAPVSALWARAPDDIRVATAEGRILHWDGGSWHVAFGAGTPFELHDLRGVASDDAWAVGQHGALLHWDGRNWSRVDSGTSSTLRAVWPAARDDVWVAGVRGTLLHGDGDTWKPVASGTTEDLTALWGSAPDDVWAVGLAGTSLHWNGTAWTEVPTTTLSNLNDVWGTGPDDVWVAGDDGTVLRWTSRIWTRVSPGVPDHLISIWASNPNDVWCTRLVLPPLHWDGTNWRTVPLGGHLSFRVVDGLGRGQVWLAGSDGGILEHAVAAP